MSRPLTVFVLLIILGCKGEDRSTIPPSLAAQPSPVVTGDASDATRADIFGRVTLRGSIPKPVSLQINKDHGVCAAGTIQPVIVNNGGIAGVVVEVTGFEQADPTFEKPADGYVMRQKNCMFTPHVLVIPNGESVEIHNDDPVGHNVNTGDWNLMQPSGADPIIQPVNSKTPVRVVCNIHSWMEGWLYPVQSTWYAVTDENGEYRIEGVPAGKCRVRFWHPYLGSKRERQQLEAGKVTQQNLEYDSPEQ